MRNNLDIRVGGTKLTNWDNVSIDSDIGIAADAFNFHSFSKQQQPLPSAIQEGKVCEVLVAGNTIMKGVIDSISETVTRSGHDIIIAGRDLAGQLMDCSAPIGHQREMTLEAILGEYVFGGELQNLGWNVLLPKENWLKAKTAVDVGESIWDVIAKAALSSGQYVWMTPEGAVAIGNPFDVKQPRITPRLVFNRDGKGNNCFDPEHARDVSGIYTDVKVVGQDPRGRNISGTSSIKHPFIKRSLIISESNADSQQEAERYAKKRIRDSLLEADTLTVTVNGFLHDGKPWRTGWNVTFDSDVLPRAKGNWVVFGRTFQLSRSNGKTTQLRLRKKQNWMNRLPHRERLSR